MAAEADVSPGWPAILRTQELKDKIKSAHVLCVGAGGIGCELLKTLVCSGFRNIEVIDLDTIETSNLNRQFLFRKHHVGQSKAHTAAAVVQRFCPAATITAHHANVKEPRFGLDFLRRFDIVLNGLDNLDARRHVNRLCLAAERPLVESGTAGYLGQVTVHLKGRTECFECQPRAAPKTYPICTLRHTPDKPIHTIVWAKDLLFTRLFGPPEAASDMDDQAAREAGQPPHTAHHHAHNHNAGDHADANGNANGNGSEADGVPPPSSSPTAGPVDDPSFFLRRPGEGPLEHAGRVFARVYAEDIATLVEFKEMWEKRPPPRPLSLAELLPEGEMERLRQALAAAKQGQAAAEGGEGAPAGSSLCASRALGLTNASQKWTPSQNAAVLLLSMAMYHELRPGEVGSASFDKDDDLAVDFVTAASNLRSACYSIPEQSLFDAKGMAGNIIHAIATTNAIISGLIATEAIKILAGRPEACRNTFLYEHPADRRLVVVSGTAPPNPGCMVCGKAQLTLRINTQTTTLAAFISGVVKKRLSVNMPNLLAGDFLYEEGEGLEEDEVADYNRLLPRPMASLPGGGLGHGVILTLQDQSQGFSVDIIIQHAEDLTEEAAPEGFTLEGAVPAATAAAPAAAPGAASAQAAEAPRAKAAVKERGDGVLVLDGADEEDREAAPGGIRKRAFEEEGEEPGPKRPKATAATDDDDDDVLITG